MVQSDFSINISISQKNTFLQIVKRSIIKAMRRLINYAL